MTAPVTVRPSSSSIRLARPKSVTWAWPSRSSRMLAGFRSRWRMPRWWAWWTASATSATILAASRWVGLEVGEGLLHALAVDQLHAEIALVFERADLVDRHDPGVVERGDGLGLVLEPADLLLAGELGVADHLQGDVPVQGDLAGPVDHAHPAPAEDADQLVIADVADPDAGRDGCGPMARARCKLASGVDRPALFSHESSPRSSDPSTPGRFHGPGSTLRIECRSRSSPHPVRSWSSSSARLETSKRVRAHESRDQLVQLGAELRVAIQPVGRIERRLRRPGAPLDLRSDALELIESLWLMIRILPGSDWTSGAVVRGRWISDVSSRRPTSGQGLRVRVLVGISTRRWR